MRPKNSRLLQISAILGSAGNSAVHVAVPWLVLEITGSSAQAGIVLGISGISVIFTAPIIGGVIAVLGARRVSMWSDLISATSVILFPIVNGTVGLNFLWLLLIAIFGAMFDPAGATARKSMIQRVATEENLLLEKFNGQFEASAITGTIAGPAGAALLIGLVGIDITFVIITSAFILASATVRLVSIDTTSATRTQKATVSNVMHETRTGMSVLWRDKPLLSLVGLYTMLTAIYMPVETIVLSRHFKDLDQPHVLGFILSSMSIGIVIGALQFHRVIAHMSPPTLVMTSMSGIGLVVCAMALLPDAFWFVGLGLALGLVFGPVSPMSNFLVQRRVPENLHGPVFGTLFSLTHVVQPVGSLALGLIIASVSVPLTLLVIGLLFISVTLLVGLLGPMKHLTTEMGTSGPSVSTDD
jgi:MFS family permease